MPQGPQPVAQRGFTIPELLVSLVLLSIIMGVAIPRFTGLRDRMSVRGAASLAVSALSDARESAMRLNTRVAFIVDTGTSRLVVRSGSDTMRVIDLREIFRASVSTSRDSIAYSSTGLGYGAANSRYIITRGGAAESVTVSRLGRVR